MVKLEGYYLNPQAVEALRMVDSGSPGYPYGLRIYMSNREQFQINYNSQFARGEAVTRLCREIDAATPAAPVTRYEVETMLKSAKDALRRDIKKLSVAISEGAAHDAPE